MKKMDSISFRSHAFSVSCFLGVLYIWLFQTAVQAQTAITLANSRWIEVDACVMPEGSICDNGGTDNDYQANFDGGCVIYTTPGATISLYGRYDTETSYDRISVYDGYRDSGSPLALALSGSDTLALSSSTGFLSIRFQSDAATNGSGFLFHYHVSGRDSLCENFVDNFSLSSLSPTGASLSWSNSRPDRPLSLLLNDSLFVVSGGGHSFSHLAPAHLYHLSVADSAHADNRCCYSHFSFRTPCIDSFPAPFVEDFDDYGVGPDVIPDCWTRLSNFDDDQNQPQISASPDAVGGALRLYCGSNDVGGHFSMVVSPQITTPAASLLLRLRLRSPHTGVSVQVGICEGNSLYTNNFVPVATLTTSFADVWQDYIVPLDDVQASGRRIALRMLRGQQDANQRVVWVDDLSVECCGVSQLVAFDRSTHSLWLQWEQYGGVSGTDVEIGPLGFVSGTGRRLSDVSSPLRIDGLQPASVYEFHVIPHCQACAPLQPYVSISATTLQPDLTEAQLCESFENPSALLPYGWRAVGDDDGVVWASLQSNRAFEGQRSLSLQPGSLHPQRTVLLPLFDTVSLSSLKLMFRCFSLSPARLLVGVLESPENVSGFEVVDTVTIASTQQWMSAEVDFSHYQGTASCIALRPLGVNGAVFVDNLQLGACLLSDVSISQITSTGLMVHWTLPVGNPAPDSVAVLWGAPGFAADTAQRMVVAAGADLQSSSQVALQGLIPSTDYELLVYGFCGSSQLPCDMNRHRVHTLSNDIVLPFCEDFENGTSFPEGWSRCNTFGGYPSVTSSIAHGGTYALAFNSYGSLNDAYSMVALPYLADTDIRQLILSFHSWAWCNSGRLQVGVMDNPDDLASFVTVASLPVSASQWREQSVSFSDYVGTGRYIAIRFYLDGPCSSNSAVIVDDLMLSSCIVSNVRHSDINSHSVTISWDSIGTAFSGAVVELGRIGFTQGTGTLSGTVRGGRLVVDTLQRGVTYNYYVYPMCIDSATACLSSRYGFTTLPESLVDGWCNDFDHLSSFPDGWQRPLVVAGYPQLSDDTLAGGKRITLFSSNSASSMLLLPPLEEDSLSGLSFRVAVSGSRDYECNCRLLLGFLTDPSDPASFELLDSLNLTHSDSRYYLFDLGRYTGSGRHLAFLKVGSLYASVDNMALSRCFPTDVAAADITDRSFALSWHRSACADTTWVALSSDMATTNPQQLYCIPTADTVLHFDSLLPGAVYRCLLWGSAADTLSPCRAVSITAPLLPPPVVAPICFNFNSETSGELPYGWSVLDGDTAFVDGSIARGSRSLRLRSRYCGALSSDDVTVVMPSVDSVDLSDLYLDFWFFDDNLNGNSHLVVGVMDHPQDVSTFSPIDTFRVAPSAWHHLQLALAPYAGSGHSIAFRYGMDSPCHTASAFLDDVSLDFGRITSCSASATTEHSVDLSWNATAAVDSVWVEYRAAQGDFEAGSGVFLTSSASPITVTGLDAGTRYVFHFYTAADACNYETAVVETFFEREEVPLCQDFESAGSGVFLAGWDRWGDSLTLSSTDNHTEGGSRSLHMSVASDGCATLVLPRLLSGVDCSQRDSLYGLFWLRAVSGNGLLVAGYVSDSDNTNFTAAGDSLLLSGVGQWQRQLLRFNHANDSTKRLAVRLCATDGAGAVVSVDDFCLQSCVATDVTLSQVGTHSVVVDWNGFGTDSMVCEYGPAGFVPGTGDSAMLTAMCDSIGNLLAGTAYDFLFSTVCPCGLTGRVAASDGEDVIQRLSARTQPEALALPWCETFDGDTASFAAIWSRTAVGNSGFPTFASSPGNGGRCLLFTAGTSSPVVVLLPPVGAGQGSGVLLSLSAYADNVSATGTGARLMVALQSHPDSVSSRVMLDTLTLDEPGMWQHFVVDLNDDIANHPFVALVLEGNGGAVRCFVDDVSMAYCAVNDVSLNVESDSLVVSWTAFHDPHSVAVEYGPHGFAPGQGIVLAAMGSECRIGGLDLRTSYDVYVSPLCDGTTAEGCPLRPLTYVPGRSLPFCEDFSSWGSGDNAFPSGWQRHNTWNNNRYLRVDNDNMRNALHFQCNSSGYSYAVLPEMDIDSLRRCHLYLTMSSNDCTNTALIVGVSNNPDDVSDFTPVDTLRNSVANYDNWEDFHVSFANCGDSGRFIVLRQMVFGTPSTRHISVDGVFVSSFPRPSVALEDWNSVRVTVDSSVHGCWMAVVPHGQIPDVLPIFCSSGDTVISGLQASTTYDIYAWSESQWTPCATCAATALCALFATVSTSIPLPLPYCEDFADCGIGVAALPDGWYRAHDYSSFNAMSANPWPRVVMNTDNQAVLRFQTLGDYAATVVLPPIADGEGDFLALSFDMKPSDYRYVTLEVGTVAHPNDMGTFHHIATLQCDANFWQHREVALTALTDTGRYVALRMLSTNGLRTVDVCNLVLQPCPPLKASLASFNSVSLSVDSAFLSFPSDLWVEYGLHGFAQGASADASHPDGVRLLHIDELPFTVDDLQPLSDYDFYVRCDSSSLSCLPPLRMATGVVHGLPWCEDFDAALPGALPSGWTAFTSTSTAVAVADGVGQTATTGLTMTASNSTTPPLVVLPQLGDDADSTGFITFRYRFQSGFENRLRLQVGWLTDGSDPDSFVATDTLTAVDANWTWASVSLSDTLHRGFVALQLQNSAPYPATAFLDGFVAERCLMPADLRLTLVNHNSFVLSSDAPVSTPFYVEVGPEGFTQGTGTLWRCDTLPFVFEWPNDSVVDCYVRCDSLSFSCRPPLVASTVSAPVPLPLCVALAAGDSLPVGWRRLDDLVVLPPVDAPHLDNLLLCLRLHCFDAPPFEVGLLRDGLDPSSFEALPSFLEPCDSGLVLSVPLAAIPADVHFLALRMAAAGDVTIPDCVDRVSISDRGIWNVSVSDVDSDGFTLDWQHLGSGSVVVVCTSPGRDSVLCLDVSAPPLRLAPLRSLTPYQVSILPHGSDDWCTAAFLRSKQVYTPGGSADCIDPTDLSAVFVRCAVGSFDNPSAVTERVDFGADSPLSRHTVHSDTAERDQRTGGLLRTVPPDGLASVRLGNWSSNPWAPEGESVEYSLYVNSDDFDLLLLRYAAVLQDPLHDPDDQPRFSLDVLDSAGNPLSQCAMADFRADYTAGWHIVDSSHVLWKDWTTVGVDLAPFSGQLVRIRLTTRDCNEGSHFGYAYFSLRCASKRIETSHCGGASSNTFTAPPGFIYTWYEDPDNIDGSSFSHDQSISVATDSSRTFFCKCAFADDSSCFFTLTAFAGARYPLANASPSVTVSDCRFHVSFENTSAVSADGITPLVPFESCESAAWWFGNGDSSLSYNAASSYDAPGDYVVTLVSSIASGECVDTLRLPLHLQWVPSSAALLGDTSCCAGDTLSFTCLNIANPRWALSDTISSLSVCLAPVADTVVRCFFVNSNGCLDSLSRSVRVRVPSFAVDSVSLCDNELPFQWADTLLGSGTPSATFSFQYTSAAGCDSTVSLVLDVRRSSLFAESDTVVENALPLSRWGLLVSADSLLPDSADRSLLVFDSSFVLSNAAGCDSSVSLSLRVFRNRLTVLDTVACTASLPLHWQGTVFDSADFDFLVLDSLHHTDTLLLAAVSGADSVVLLSLSLLQPSHFSDSDSVVENALPLFRWGMVIDSDRLHTVAIDSSLLAFDTSFVVTNAEGCDSSVSLSLRVFRNRYSSVDSTLCFSSLPLLWNGVPFSGADIPDGEQPPLTISKSVSLSSATGADSIVAMNLLILPSYFLADSVHICRNNMPFQWLDTSFSVNSFSDVYFRNYLSVDGCDSVHSLNLVISDVYQVVDHVESCNPITWIDGHTYSERTFGPQVTLTSRLGCDSIVTLDFRRKAPAIVRITDSFCVNGTYLFDGRSITTSGIYFDSMLTVEGCDSIVMLTLTQLPLPRVSFDLDPDCNLRGFLISAHADVDVLQWNSDIGWNAEWGDASGDRIWIAPRLPMLLTLTADYSLSPLCPVSVSVPLSPMLIPEASVEVSPEYLSDDKDNFLAIDRSRSSTSRVWWVDDIFYGDDPQIWCRPENNPDSVVITLIAMTEFCEDTAVKVIPYYRHNIFAPNAFTPGLSTNNRFSLAVSGLEDFDLAIYNRAGLLVFHSSDPSAAWDGSYRGRPCPQGSYVWILSFSTADKPRQPQSQKGTVTLIR